MVRLFQIDHVDQCSQLTINLVDRVDPPTALHISYQDAGAAAGAGAGLAIRVEAPDGYIRLSASEVDLLADWLMAFAIG